MNCQISYKVSMFVNNFKLFARVVVVDTNLSIVRTHDDPLLARHELGAAHCTAGEGAAASRCALLAALAAWRP